MPRKRERIETESAPLIVTVANKLLVLFKMNVETIELSNEFSFILLQVIPFSYKFLNLNQMNTVDLQHTHYLNHLLQ